MIASAATLSSPLLDGMVASLQGNWNAWLHDFQLGYSVLPSKDWRIGGPALEALYDKGMLLERIDSSYDGKLPRFRATFDGWVTCYRGDSMLEAGFRAMVACALGDNFEVPAQIASALSLAESVEAAP